MNIGHREVVVLRRKKKISDASRLTRFAPFLFERGANFTAKTRLFTRRLPSCITSIKTAINNHFASHMAQYASVMTAVDASSVGSSRVNACRQRCDKHHPREMFA
jgi:hypothetical protein